MAWVTSEQFVNSISLSGIAILLYYFLFETKVSSNDLRQIFPVDARGQKGGLSFAWSSEVDITLKSYSKYHIDVNISHPTKDVHWRFTRFFGELNKSLNDRFW